MAFDVASRRQGGKDWSCGIGDADSSAGGIFDGPITRKDAVVIAVGTVLGWITGPFVRAAWARRKRAPKLYNQFGRKI